MSRDKSQYTPMKMHRFLLLAFASKIALLNFNASSAYDDSERLSLRGKINSKVNKKRSLDGIFPSGAQASNTSDTIAEASGGITPSIVEGEDVIPQEYPSFFVWLNGCAGTLVAPNVVLSSVHCKKTSPTAATFVTLGMNKRLLDEEVDFNKIEHIPVAESVLHPSYDPETKQYDFWLIKLQWATSQYASIDLDKPDDYSGDSVSLKSADNLVTMGFGLTSDGIAAEVLQMATVKYITHSNCTNANLYSYRKDEIYGSMICARGDGGEDTCEGDSGGPLVHVATNVAKTKTLVGVASWGDVCGDPTYPGVYARVSKGYDFLNSKIEEWWSNVGPLVTDCKDRGGFYDSDGVAYNCMWYAQGNCEMGTSFPNAGMTAKEACCACGGGIRKPTHSPTRSPTSVPTSMPTTKRPTSKPTKA